MFWFNSQRNTRLCRFWHCTFGCKVGPKGSDDWCCGEISSVQKCPVLGIFCFDCKQRLTNRKSQHWKIVKQSPQKTSETQVPAEISSSSTITSLTRTLATVLMQESRWRHRRNAIYVTASVERGYWMLLDDWKTMVHDAAINSSTKDIAGVTCQTNQICDSLQPCK